MSLFYNCKGQKNIDSYFITKNEYASFICD